MKRFCFLLLCLAMSLLSTAQNWQCLQPGRRVYFTNSAHYLQGMRIDSVRAGSGGSTLFYPYLTPRGAYDGRMSGVRLDTTKGSWLGKKVEALANGKTLFYNYWNDTVVIETALSVGATWTFYSDTTSVWYQASILSKDTMTIEGALDSVKKIAIQAKIGSANISGDPINRIHLLLSKAHGFEHAFDLYTFPYHRPDSPAVAKFDYMLEEGGTPLDSAGLMLARASFHNPGYPALYDYQPGDIYQTVQIGWYPVPDKVTTDSIISRSLTASQLSYSVLRKITSMTGYGSRNGPTYTTTYGTISLSFPNGPCLIVDTLKMPEEWHNTFFNFYDPADTNYGYQATRYVTRPTYIFPNGILSLFEPCGTTTYYKVGLGIVLEDVCLDPYPAPGNSWRSYLSYYRKGGVVHGTYNSLAVGQAIRPQAISLFPNPASSQLSLALPYPQACSIIAQDAMGEIIYRKEYPEASFHYLDVRSWPAGIYFIRVSAAGGATCYRQVVAH